MSASNEKKKRKAAREQAARETRRKPPQKKRRGLSVALGILAIAVILALILISALKPRLPWGGEEGDAESVPSETASSTRSETQAEDPVAATVGDTEFTVGQVRYLFMQTYMTFAANGLIDGEKPVSEQPCDYLEDGTWEDYLINSVSGSLQQLQALSDQAKEDGYTLSEEGKETVDSSMAVFWETAEEYDMSVEDYLAGTYGPGVTEDVVRELIEKSVLAEEYDQYYQDSLTYTDRELEDYFNEHREDFLTYDYLYYYVRDDAVPEEAVESLREAGIEDGTEAEEPESAAEGEEASSSEQTAELTPAQTFANLIANYITDEDTFRTAVDAFAPGDEPTLAEEVPTANLPVDWLTEEDREYGDTVIASGEEGCYVIMYVGVNDQNYKEVNVRHILVMTEDTDEDGSYSGAERAAARKKLKEIQARWEDGERTEESFAELANECSEDTGSNTNGGLYEGVYQGQMVEEFDEFCFDEDRGPGDTGIVHGSTEGYDGYHLIYFVGTGELHSLALARDAMFNQAYSDWQTKVYEDHEVEMKADADEINPGL